MTELYQVPLAAHHDPQIHVHAVAASPTGFILESFADPTRDPLWFELFLERPKIVDGFMAIPDAPGLGLELRAETLEKYGVKVGRGRFRRYIGRCVRPEHRGISLRSQVSVTVLIRRGRRVCC